MPARKIIADAIRKDIDRQRAPIDGATYESVSPAPMHAKELDAGAIASAVADALALEAMRVQPGSFALVARAGSPQISSERMAAMRAELERWRADPSLPLVIEGFDIVPMPPGEIRIDGGKHGA